MTAPAKVEQGHRMMRSPCCNAEVGVREARYDRGARWHYCTACGEACDPVEDADTFKWLPIPPNEVGR